MIIEAAPRLRDGPLVGYLSTPSKLELGKIHFERTAPAEKNCYRLVKTRKHSEINSLQDRDKTRTDLLDCVRTSFRTNNWRSSHRGHPYDRKGIERRGGKKRDFSFSALSNLKCSCSLRSLPREKAVELLKQNFSPNLRRKFVKREDKTESTFRPIFTANANENNDNCAGTTYGFAITSTSSVADNICDVEIEDLSTTENNTLLPSPDSWRKRRTSFNTNPLSTSSRSPAKPHSPSCLEDLFSRNSGLVQADITQESNTADTINNLFLFSGTDSEGKNSHSVDGNRKSRPHNTFDNSAKYEENASERWRRTGRIEGSATSFEKLVEFFESNSAAIPHSLNTDKNFCQKGLASSEFRHGKDNIHHRPSLFRSSPTQQIKDSQQSVYRRLRRPSISPSTSYQSRSNSTDFSQFLHSDWDCVIEVSSGHSQNYITSTLAGGVYNNNRNAASAPPESGPNFWPCSQLSTDQFYIGRYENSRKTSSCHSPVFFPGDRGRCTSSLSQVSSDIELGDTESSRLASWSDPSSATFERRHQDSSCHFGNLIDLQKTSKRRNNRLRSKDSFLISQNTGQIIEGSSYTQNLHNTSDNSGDRFHSNRCQVRGRERKAVCLSANNHHNAPWVASEENLFQERLQERSSVENFHLHHTLLNPFLRKQSVFLNSDTSDMGCIQSIAKAKVSPDRCHHSVIVEDIQAAIDRTPTEIEERSPIVLRYRTPYFRASAHVIVPPIPRKETWTVGWIQACDSMKFINQYGNLGSSSWEIPALKDRQITAVSDSDGVSYPWYGNTTEIATVEGPTDTSRSLTLRMNDNFYPSVTWDIPVSEGSEAHLTHIVRDQSFTTWLAAVNQTTGRLEVLRTVKWHFYLEIDVDPTQELGKRAHIVSPLVQKQPIVLKNNGQPIYISSPHRSSGHGSAGSRQKRLNRRPGAGGDNNSNNHTNFIPKSALIRPSANNAQTLIWRPTRDVPVIVVPAKEEYKENNEVVWFTRTPTMHGHDHNVRVLSLQEMTQIKKTIS